jgi:hypothetical protein
MFPITSRRQDAADPAQSRVDLRLAVVALYALGRAVATRLPLRLGKNADAAQRSL